MKDIFLLDVDDTLLDFAKGERAQIASTLAHFGIAPTPRMAQRFHEINDGLWKRLERGELTRERLLTLRFELFFEEFGLKGDAAAFNARRRAVLDAFRKSEFVEKLTDQTDFSKPNFPTLTLRLVLKPGKGI